MLVQKTIHRYVVTLAHGRVRVNETVQVCAAGCVLPSGARLTHRSGELRRLVPPGSVFGYDVEVAVGLARFLRHRQREEIRSELVSTHGVTLSSGQVSALANRFARHLQVLHTAKAQEIRAAMEADGGYPLHVDATGENGRGTLLVAYAGWRHWVLGARKLETEHADAIVPLLHGVIRDFGPPCAFVRDLGRAVTEAVNTARQSLPRPVPVFACHQHLLRDIGTDLLKPAYDRLRALFRDLGVRSKLGTLVRDLGRRLGDRVPALRLEVRHWAEEQAALPAGSAGLAVVRALGQWVLDYADDGRHRGFPFDRPYLDLYHRCLVASQVTARLAAQARGDRVLDTTLQRLHQTLSPVRAEVAFRQVARGLEARCRLFDELRDVLRLDREPAPAGSPDHDKPAAETPVTLREVENAYDKFVSALRARRATPRLPRDDQEALDLVLRHLDHHGPYLWGHVLPGPQPGTVRVVARTNNILEGFFHTMKHGERRRSGRKILTHDFEALPGEAALASNLTHDDYVALVCGSLHQLPDLFRPLQCPGLRSRVPHSRPFPRSSGPRHGRPTARRPPSHPPQGVPRAPRRGCPPLAGPPRLAPAESNRLLTP